MSRSIPTQGLFCSATCRRSCSLTSLAMSQKLAGTGLGQPHEVLDFDVMIEFRLFVRGKGGGFLALDQVPYALASLFGGLEFNNLSWTQRGDEFNEFFVGF